MTWYDEMLAWLRAPEPPLPGDAAEGWRRVSERIAKESLSGRGLPITPQAMRAAIASWARREGPRAPGIQLTDEERAEVARRDRERVQMAPPTASSWRCGATTDEVLVFALSACTCGACSADNRPDGSSIPLMPDEELRRLLALARQRLGSNRTSWLEGYAADLVTELRRRAGAC